MYRAALGPRIGGGASISQGDCSMSFNARKRQFVLLRTVFAALCAAAVLQTPRAFADAAVAADAEGGLDEVIVTGTRELGIKAVDSPAPIQIVSATELKSVGASDLMSALVTLVPSLQ